MSRPGGEGGQPLGGQLVSLGISCLSVPCLLNGAEARPPHPQRTCRVVRLQRCYCRWPLLR